MDPKPPQEEAKVHKAEPEDPEMAKEFSELVRGKDGVEEGVIAPTDITETLEESTAASVGEDAVRLIATTPLILFSKTWCPFCLELKRTLDELALSYSVVELNELGTERMNAVQDRFDKDYDMRTVPHFFVNGQSVKGCRDVKALQHSGELYAILSEFINHDVAPRPDTQRPRLFSLFWFPDTVNNKVIRGVSCLVVIAVAFCIAFYEATATPWCVLGLAIDYALRLLAGARLSPLGLIVTALDAPMEPDWASGPPKQFAAFCGWFLSTWSAGLFLGGYRLGGAVVLAGLLGAASLEAFFGFCLGCFMYGWGIRLGLIPANVYRVHLNMVESRKWAYMWSHEKRVFPNVTNSHVLLPGQKEESPADLVRKERFRKEYKLEDIDPMRHMKIAYFQFPMAVAALAVVFNFVDDGYLSRRHGGEERGDWLGPQLFHTFTLASALLLVFMLGLYALRFVLHPQKCLKEFRHPEYSGSFSAVCICAVLIAIAIEDEDGSGIQAHVLLWIAASAQMALAVERISDLVFERHFEQVLNPGVMITPVGTLVSALGIASYADDDETASGVNYREFAVLWFSVGTLFAVTLFILSFRKAVLDHWSEPRSRIGVWIWLATTSIMGPAFQAVSPTPVVDGVLYQSLWGLSAFFVLLLLNGILRGFFHFTDSRANFIYAFSLSAFALSSYQFHAVQEDRLTKVIAITSIATATTVTGVATLYMLVELFDGSLFRPGGKWGPASFTELTHEAFRFGLPRAGKVIAAMDATKPHTIAGAMEVLDDICHAMNEHSHQEETVIFKYARRFFPGMAGHLDREHEDLHSMTDKFQSIIADFRGGGASSVSTHVEFLKEKYPIWVDDVLEHLRHEEAVLGPILRKYMPLRMQVDMLEDVWKSTSAESWHRLMSFTVKNLPHPKWQTRYVTTFIWAMPERCHEVGLILYRTVDSVTWTWLSIKLPEIIPRGLPGYKKIY